MRLYAITDAARLSPSQKTAEEALTALARQWAAGGVEVIQIRERQMSSCSLERLARRVVAAVREAQVGKVPHVLTKVPTLTKVFPLTKVLINGRVDVAIAAGADGVHLPGEGAMTPAEVRQLYAQCAPNPPVISVACHAVRDVERARDNGATMAVFGPVFGKVLAASEGRLPGTGDVLPGVGLRALAEACQAAGSMPVFALGGVTLQNAAACIDSGGAGVAAIRLFQSSGWQSLG